MPHPNPSPGVGGARQLKKDVNISIKKRINIC
jgi:hypothetical protein